MKNLRDEIIKYSALKCFIEKDSPTFFDFIETLLDSCEKRDELFAKVRCDY
ncbi:MAG: hypothetical protein AB1765_03800 [Candidatus Hydrogenedentota bacterium]